MGGLARFAKATILASVALNCAAVIFMVVLAVTGADVTPLSRLRSPACAALTWLMVGLPVSVGVVAGVLLMKIYRGTAVRRIGLRAALVLLIFWLLRMVASFRIDEGDFIAWARQKQWDLREVRGVEVHDISATCDMNDSVLIRVDGYINGHITPRTPGGSSGCAPMTEGKVSGTSPRGRTELRVEHPRAFLLP